MSCSQSGGGTLLGPAPAAFPAGRTEVIAVIRSPTSRRKRRKPGAKDDAGKKQPNRQHVSVEQTHPGQGGTEGDARHHEVGWFFNAELRRLMGSGIIQLT